MIATTLVALAAGHMHHHHPFPRHPECRTVKCAHRADQKWAAKHRPACTNQSARECVIRFIETHRTPEPEAAWLLRIPGCESSWNAGEPPNSAGATGLYQFLPSTWAGTPYGGRSIYSAFWQVRAADYLYRRDGGGSEWVCV